MLGGLARRVAYVEKLRAEKGAALVVDSGDLFFSSLATSDREKTLKKARLIGQAYRRMEAAAVNVGDLDLLQGLEFLLEESSHGLPLISANLLDPQKKAPLFRPYVVREISGVRMAFFGLLPSDFLPDREKALEKALGGKPTIKNPVEAARETVQKLQGQADLIVLLSDLGLYKDQQVAKEVPGIHFILGGHEGRSLQRPNQVGRTYIFQSYAKGMYVGVLRIKMVETGSPFSDEGRISDLEEQINRLDLRIRSLQRSKRGQSGERAGSLDRTIQELSRQKTTLQDRLKQARETPPQGNRFLFALDPLEGGLPEDGRTRKEIAEAGIDRD